MATRLARQFSTSLKGISEAGSRVHFIIPLWMRFAAASLEALEEHNRPQIVSIPAMSDALSISLVDATRSVHVSGRSVMTSEAIAHSLANDP